MTQTNKARKPGRPATATPKLGAGGKGRVLTINVSQELRDSLEAAAEKTGRPMSQIAEQWMNIARMIGGNRAVASGVEKLVEIATAVDAAEPDPWAAAIALRAAWTKAARYVVPSPNLTEKDLAHFMRVPETWDAGRRVLRSIDEAGEADPVYRRAMEQMDGLLGPTSIARRLNDGGDNALRGQPDHRFIQDLEALRAAGETARV